jgi:hypothetical protein
MKTKDEIYALAKNYADHLAVIDIYQKQLAVDCFMDGYELAQKNLYKEIETIKEDAHLLELFKRN